MFCKGILSIPSIENSYLQTGKEKTTNKNATMAVKLTHEWVTKELQLKLWM
jgi:hypothetical protein